MSHELNMKLDQLETLAQQSDNKIDSKTILFDSNTNNHNNMSNGDTSISASDANQIFNLISQLNDDARQDEDEGVVVNGSGNVDLMDIRDQGDSFDDINNNYTITEANVADLSKQMQSSSLNDTNNENSISMGTNRPHGIPTLSKTSSNGSSSANSSQNSMLTKIPRISHTNIPKPVTSYLPSPSAVPLASSSSANPTHKSPSTLDGVKQSSIPVCVASNTMAPPSLSREKTQTISASQSVSIPSSIPTASSKQITKTLITREPRSVSKSNSQDQAAESEEQKMAWQTASTTKKVVAKRGASCSTRVNNKATRSMSINPDNDASRETLNNDNEPKFNSDGTRNVKYIVRHKPRESQVKIFSQKLELKNVTSKIGSLDNYDHKPAGGAVVIESKELNWKAESKIGSLEKAANYVPAGGNVKIESRKLNWNAKSKIGSLEYANYQPKGGNIKIETQKLNFKEKAKPRTDTGLIVIETKPGSENKLNRSNSSTSDNMSSYSESCHDNKN